MSKTKCGFSGTLTSSESVICVNECEDRENGQSHEHASDKESTVVPTTAGSSEMVCRFSGDPSSESVISVDECDDREGGRCPERASDKESAVHFLSILPLEHKPPEANLLEENYTRL
ncbi:MAG: hypothetical protein ABW168_25485 [Sedimenticola sp.]